MTLKHRAALMVWSLHLALLLAACEQGAATTPTTAPTAAGVTAEAATAETAPVLPTPAPTNPPPTEPPTPTAEPTPAPTATRPPLGTAERPVQLLFPPVAVGAVTMQRAAPLVEALRAATGAEFAVGIADSEAALVELLCAAPEDTIGFVSAAAYTIAHEECDAQAGLVAVQEDGLTWQMGMLVTRPGEAEELADLAGQRWASADTRSLPDYLYFQAQLAAAGIEPGEMVSAPEETSALLALTSDEADFTTAQYVPPIMPQGRAWVYGESEPEEWRLLGVSPSRSPIGYVIVAAEPELGGYRLRDARARLFDTTPDIFDATRILALSEPIPNETVVLGADFPPELAQQTLETLTAFAASEACGASLCSADFLGWAGLEPADDAAYDPIRTIKDTLDLEAADLWAELD
jgi:ABC-type phosphate/phosphonate transport system substrate-binding protein